MRIMNISHISWKADVKAGFIVSLIALPLCLGIATASGFPPFAGIITAIIGGLLTSWIGSARFTIKGPAAGLIVIVLGAVMELGQGNMIAGYHKALAVGVVAGILQLILALIRMAGLGIAISKTVVHGMLAAIGIIIIAKQAHVMLGVTPTSQDTLLLLSEIPQSFINMDYVIGIIGFMSLFILIYWDNIAIGVLRAVPAPLVVLLIAVPFSVMAGIDSSYQINLPDSVIEGFAFPDFSDIASITFIQYVIMFALVGAIESTLTVVASDAMKEYQHASDLNRDLFATSVGNIIASSLGGLPMISEIVRSKANIDAGATSHIANVAHGAFLLFYVVILSNAIELIPLASLAAMLVLTGLRLASYKEWRHAYYIGKDQLFLFSITVIVTLLTDLLIGVGTGLIAKIMLHAYRGVSPVALFRSHIQLKQEAQAQRIIIKGNAAFPALIKIRNMLRHINDEARHIIVDIHHVALVDHTFLSGLHAVFAQYPLLSYSIEGKNNMRALGHSEYSVHVKSL